MQRPSNWWKEQTVRGGYPVRPEQVFPWDDNGNLGKSYWRVGAGMAGDCGHKHRTQAAAEKCVEPMTLKYREARWPGSTKKGKA